MPTSCLRCLAVLALAAPLAHAQDAPPPLQRYVRASAGWGGIDYRVDTQAGPPTRSATALGASVEVGVPVAPTVVLGLPGPETLGIEVSLTRAEIGNPEAPFAATSLPPLTAWQSSVVAVSRSRFSAGPVDVSSGFGLGIGYSASYELTSTGMGDVRSGFPVFLYESRRMHRVAPLLHIDVAFGHSFGSTFVGAGTTFNPSLIPGQSSPGGVRLGVEVQQTF